MSTLKTNKIQHLTSGFNNVVQFVDGAGTQNGTLCRAFVNFNGQGAVAVRANFNVNSLTDHGTGDYTVNFTNAMSDANYSWSGSVQDSNSSGNVLVGNWTRSGVSPTTSALRIYTGYHGGVFDAPIITLQVFR